MESIIARHEQPDPNVPPLAFETVYARSTWEQYLICCRKFNITYWRTPEYNGTRFYFSVAVALMCASILCLLRLDSLLQWHANILSGLKPACNMSAVLWRPYSAARSPLVCQIIVV